MKLLSFALASVAFLMSAEAANAQAPLWMRDVKISPDGKEIAFTYRGDIYKVAAKGGKAVRLTAAPSWEAAPVWSPDGKKIAFVSSRNGGRDIYIMSSDGGTPTRLTFNSANENPEGFTPDGKNVLYSASIQDPASSALFPSTCTPWPPKADDRYRCSPLLRSHQASSLTTNHSFMRT